MSPLFALRLCGGDETIETTPDYPFYTLDRGWVNAEDLRFGDLVPQLDGEIEAVRWIEVVQRSQPMYNLTLTSAHTFFVGDQRWLVHNANLPCIPILQGDQPRDLTRQAHSHIKVFEGSPKEKLIILRHYIYKSLKSQRHYGDINVTIYVRGMYLLVLVVL